MLEEMFCPIFLKHGFELDTVDKSDGEGSPIYRLRKIPDKTSFYSISMYEHQNSFNEQKRQMVFTFQDRGETSRIMLSKCVHDMTRIVQQLPQYRLRHLMGEPVTKWSGLVIKNFEEYNHICDPAYFEELKQKVNEICTGKRYKKRTQSLIRVYGEPGRIFSKIVKELGLSVYEVAYARFREVHILVKLSDEATNQLKKIGFH